MYTLKRIFREPFSGFLGKVVGAVAGAGKMKEESGASSGVRKEENHQKKSGAC